MHDAKASRGMSSLRTICAVSCAVVALLATNVSAKDIRLVSNLESNDSTIQNSLMPFIKGVKDATGGSLNILFNGPDVVPPFEQFQPVQAGAFQLLYTHPVYFNGTTSVGMCVDATLPDPATRRASGFFDRLDAFYQTQGMKLIAIPANGTKGYQFIVKKPLGDAPSLQGRKIRGTATYNPVIEGFGGTPVVLAAGEVYTSLDRGVIDGAAWGPSGVVGRKWYEVAKYMTRPTFGSNSNIVLMNKAAFDSLTPAEQKAILDEGRKMELATPPAMDRIIEKEWAELRSLGMSDTMFPASERAKLEEVFQSGIWALASKTDPSTVQALRAIAIKGGISK